MTRKRLVRLHLENDLPSLEGLLDGYRTRWNGGHYTLRLAQLLEHSDGNQPVQYSLEGGRVRVPRERVAFVQELK